MFLRRAEQAGDANRQIILAAKRAELLTNQGFDT
jgi:hypothetical protein